MSALASFLKMLEAGKDGALLRYSLGNEYAKAGDAANAALHLRHAVTLDPEYTAAWKLLGRMLADSGRPAEALAMASRSPAAAATSRRKKKCRSLRGASSAPRSSPPAQTRRRDWPARPRGCCRHCPRAP
jgi:predicted Zn-dependent protease